MSYQFYLVSFFENLKSSKYRHTGTQRYVIAIYARFVTNYFFLHTAWTHDHADNSSAKFPHFGAPLFFDRDGRRSLCISRANTRPVCFFRADQHKNT